MSREAMVRRAFVLAFVQAASLVGYATSGRAADPPQLPGDSKAVNDHQLLFRRVMVPEEQVPELARGYLPIKRDEFQRLVDAVLKRESQSPVPAVEIQQGEYSARFSGSNLIEGKASLLVTHRASEPQRLLLAPCLLPVLDPVWVGTPPRPARVGANPLGQLFAEVESTGELQFSWALRGSATDAGHTRFSLQLPASPLNRLRLTLPAGIRPVAEHGLITRLPPESQAALRTSRETEDRSRDKPENHWLIELGGQSQFDLTLASDEPPATVARNALVRQATVYELLESGLTVKAELHVDIRTHPLDRLVLELDSALQVTSILAGELSLRWHQFPISDSHKSRLEIDLPRPITAASHDIHLTGVASFELDQSWQLPTLVPRNAVWQQGEATLLVSDSLELRHMHVPHGRRALRQANPALPERAIQLDLFEPDAQVTLQLSRHQPELRVAIGTTFRMDATSMQARTAVDLIAVSGNTYAWECRVPADWIVDSVESQPADQLEEFELLTGSNSDPARLLVKLQKPVSRDQRTRLIIRTRGRRPAGNPWLAWSQLRPLSLKSGDRTRVLVALNPDPTANPELAGDGSLRRLSPRELFASDAELLDAYPGALIFADDHGADNLRFRRHPTVPRYAARVEAIAAVEGGTLHETYSIHCEPQTLPVGRVVIHCSQSRSTSLSWNIVSKKETAIATRRLSGEDQRRLGLMEGESWEVTLAEPTGGIFTLTAERSTPFTDGMPVGLTTLPEADSQVGYLRIDAEEFDLRVEANGLTQIPTAPTPPDRFTSTLASYRYEPVQQAAVTLSKKATADQLPLARVWGLDLTSRYAGSVSVHQAVGRIENTGASSVTFRLPSEATLVRALLNDREVSVGNVKPLAAERNWEIALPAGKRFVALTLEYTMSAGPVPVFGTLSPPSPLFESTPLHTTWTVWLPPGMATVPADSGDFAGQGQISWDRRLLGPWFARRTSPPVNLFSRDEVRALLAGSQPDELASAGAETYLRLIDEVETPASTMGKVPTWSALLGDIQHHATELNVGTPPLRIDTAALAAADFSPQSPVVDRARSPSGNPARRGAAWLDRCNLALVAAPDMCLLTTAAAFPAYLDQHNSRRYRNVLVLNAPLADNSRPHRGLVFPSVMSVEQWTAALPWPRSPWRYTPGSAESELPGWQRVRLEVPRDELTSIPVYRPQIVRGVAWFLFVCSAGWTGWMIRWRSEWRLPLFAASLTTVLFVPTVWVPLAQSWMWSTLLVCGCHALGKRVRPAQRDLATNSDHGTRSRYSMAGGIAVGSLGLALFGPAVWGWEGDELAPPVFRVLIPINDRQQPTGDYVHLPREFYRLLHERSLATRTTADDWFVLSAQYQASLARTAGKESFEIAGLKIQYDLDVRRANTRVRLPLTEAAVVLPPDGCRLDGEPLDVEWDSDGDQLWFDVATEGRHKLELKLHPLSPPQAEERKFSLTIPRAPRARLDLQLPDDAPDVQVNSAIGPLFRDRIARSLSGELGTTSELTIQWPAKSAPMPAFDIEQLSWLKLQDGIAVLESRYKLTVPGEEKVRQVTMSIDPRLQLLPQRANSPVIRPRGSDESGLLMELDLPETDDSTIQFSTSFSIAHANGIGQLSLPTTSIPAGRLTKRWFAVSLPATLRAELSPEPAAIPGGSVAFLEGWGNADSVPQVVFQWPTDGAAPIVSTHPQDSLWDLDQRLEWVVGAAVTEGVWSGTFSGSALDATEYHLMAPPEFHPTSVVLREADTERVLSWYREESGTLVIALARPPANQHSLTCSGYLSTTQPQLDVPILQLTNRRSGRLEVLVFRMPDVNVDFPAPTNWIPIESLPLDPAARLRQRLVAAVQTPSDSKLTDLTRLPLRITPNDPDTRARVVTTLVRQADDWVAIIDYRLQVQDGTVDSLRLELPDECTDVHDFSKPVRHELVTLPGETKRHLLIWLPQAVEGDFSLQFACTLAEGTSERELVPEIAPLDVRDYERWVVLPLRDSHQSFEWETSGLRPATLPDDMGSDDTDLSDKQVYQAIAGSFHAWPRRMEPTTGRPNAILADVRLLGLNDRAFVGHVSFDIDFSEGSNCQLVLPNGCQLWFVKVEGIPADPTPIGAQSWRIALGSQRLPQRLEVCYQGPVWPDGYAPLARRLPLPSLPGFLVSRTLWSAWSDHSAATDPAAAHRILSVPAHDLQRMRTEATQIQRAAEAAGDVSPQDFQHWCRPRVARFWVAANRLRRELQAVPNPAEQTELDSLLAELSATLDRRKLQPLLDQVKLDATLAADAADLETSVEPRAEILASGAQSGYLESVVVEMPGKSPGDLWGRVLAALGLVALILLLPAALRRVPLVDWLAQHPGLVGVLIGLAWWLWLTPSALGWLIVVVSLLFAVFASRASWHSAPSSGR